MYTLVNNRKFILVFLEKVLFKSAQLGHSLT